MKSDKEFLTGIYQKAENYVETKKYTETKKLHYFSVNKTICVLAAVLAICMISAPFIEKNMQKEKEENLPQPAQMSVNIQSGSDIPSPNTKASTRMSIQPESEAKLVSLYGKVISIIVVDNTKEFELKVLKDSETGNNFSKGEVLRIRCQDTISFDVKERDRIQCEIIDSEEGYILQSYQKE